MTHDGGRDWYAWRGDILILRIKVQPRSSRNALGEVLGDRVKLYLTAPPVDGKANAAVVAFLANHFGVAKGQVTIRRGETGRDKEIHVQSPQNLAVLGICRD
ncbi:YggU family protein [Halothiobacillus diazotrophicus]|uniref:UPF0235 protein A9404_12500 n=1 Tax=Halothiobacillus diazotrophicus TaxID=1860122 RepID=A0A191ZKU5_9GAMM|nr:DUF167 family protein [Halothiobacillus diazotrophicus]ANJ68485.1 YggU family protein [Halothiobacillus diazotrophicus]